MVKVDDAAVLKRAKELCEKTGFSWDNASEMMPVKPGWPKLKGAIDEVGRQQYLARARAELLKEAGG